MSILQAHIASRSRATNINTEGVEDDVVLCLIEVYILAYSAWVMKPIFVGSDLIYTTALTGMIQTILKL